MGVKKIAWGLFILVSACGAVLMRPGVAHAATVVPVYFEGIVTEKGKPVQTQSLSLSAVQAMAWNGLPTMPTPIKRGFTPSIPIARNAPSVRSRASSI